jgi:hypothetical protein
MDQRVLEQMFGDDEFGNSASWEQIALRSVVVEREDLQRDFVVMWDSVGP